MWKKASEKLPDKAGIENKVVVRNNDPDFNNYWVTYGFKNFDAESPKLYFERGGFSYLAVDGAGNGRSTFSNKYIEWLDESNDEVEQLRAKVEFYREATDKVRELVSKSNDIGKPCQPLYDAIVDKINDLQSQNEQLRHLNDVRKEQIELQKKQVEYLESQLNKYREALEKIKDLVPQEGGKSIVEYYLDYVEELQSIATEALTPQP